MVWINVEIYGQTLGLTCGGTIMTLACYQAIDGRKCGQKHLLILMRFQKKGVFNVGWPKSDAINSNKFKLEKNKIKKKLNSKKKTILYAPSMETDNKQLDILDLAIKFECKFNNQTLAI